MTGPHPTKIARGLETLEGETETPGVPSQIKEGIPSVDWRGTGLEPDGRLWEETNSLHFVVL